MRPVLFSVLGFNVQSYGVSKALAALVAGWLLARAFDRLGLKRDSAYSVVMWATIWGFAGAKVYYLLERLPDVTLHDLGGMGFTWYGGLVGGIAAALVVVRRHRLPPWPVAAAAAVPLTIAYGVGRLGCLLAGDGTYGRPSSLPWAMTFPRGVVPSYVPVHPTPLYETLAAAAIAALLWAAARHLPPAAVVGCYLVLSGASRFLVEFLRINQTAIFGLTQPQLWAVASVLAGIVLIARNGRATRSRPPDPDAPHADEPVPQPSAA